MEPLSQPKVKLSLVFDSFKIKVKTIQTQSSSPLGVLYIDRYFHGLPTEVPVSYNQFIISYILPSVSSKSSEKSHFFSTLTQSTVYRAYPESPEALFYIMQDPFSTTLSFIILSIPFNFAATLGQFPSFNPLSLSKKYIEKTTAKEFIDSYKSQVNLLKVQSSQNMRKISVLSKQLQDIKVSPEKTVLGDCLLCYENPKSTVFLPCGHIISCGKCTVHKLKIHLNRKMPTRKKPKQCPLCNGTIIKSLEIINSKN
jgi:hypothetical protein